MVPLAPSYRFTAFWEAIVWFGQAFVGSQSCSQASITTATVHTHIAFSRTTLPRKWHDHLLNPRVFACSKSDCFRPMEDSDDSNHEDVWSPTLREDVFSNYDMNDMFGQSWGSEPRHRVEHLPLPNFNSLRSQPLNHINWPNSQSHQQQRGHNTTASTKSSSSSSRHPLSTTVNRSRSHLDLPNFPLQAVRIFSDQGVTVPDCSAGSKTWSGSK